MSQYSQMLGSFQRTGDYPMESNYIFDTVEDLIEFYSDETNSATIHPGLFRIVLDDGNGEQALYWAQLNDQDELEFRRFSSGGGELTEMIDDISLTVSAALNDLNQRIINIESESDDSWYEGD